MATKLLILASSVTSDENLRSIGCQMCPQGLIMSLEQSKNPLLETTIMDNIFVTNSSIFVKIAHYGKSSISVFLVVFAIIDKVFILGGRLGTGL